VPNDAPNPWDSVGNSFWFSLWNPLMVSLQKSIGAPIWDSFRGSLVARPHDPFADVHDIDNALGRPLWDSFTPSES